MKNSNFLTTYETQIMPKISKLDLLIKTAGSILDIEALSEILSADTEEIKKILKDMGEPCLTKENIFDVIANSSSYICKLIMREYKCGCPKFYTSFQIAYIYDLSTSKVQKAFDSLGVKKISADTLPEIFANI